MCEEKLAYVNEGGVEEDLGTVVEDVDEGLTDTREALDGLLDGTGAGGASHSDDGEEGSALRLRRRLLQAHSFGISGHRRIVRSRRQLTPSLVPQARQQLRHII